jgi:4'-phosphopantetheinyl transferase
LIFAQTSLSSVHPRLLESPDSSFSGVRIWTAEVGSISEVEIDALGSHLDATERARASRFHFERDRKSYVATRGFLRSLLGATLREDPSKLVFEYGDHGKPVLATSRHSPAVHFSVSHSTGYAIFAISNGPEVGIDLEAADRLNRSKDLAQLAARILSSNELMIWDALPNEATRAAAFLRAWTRKEAYAKATGQGLTEETLRIEVALDAAAPTASLTVHSPTRESSVARTWVLYDLSPPKGFAAALAVEQERDETP